MAMVDLLYDSDARHRLIASLLFQDEPKRDRPVSVAQFYGCPRHSSRFFVFYRLEDLYAIHRASFSLGPAMIVDQGTKE